MSCKHPSLFNSMCVVCGMKVVTGALASKGTSTNASAQANGYKLSLNMSGGKVLQMSAEEAASVTASKVSNLRSSKKLALVLDLDHTLLHAIQVEGQTPSRTSATARVIEGTTGAGSGNGVDDNVVHHLPIEEIDRLTVKHLVMKKRPHLDEFLEKASEFCQLTVYTAGTRRYAEAVARVIDPTRKYFADRIVSRCDVANIRADGNDKSLERIFPGDASMAVIIDDREDVWRGPQGAQLLLVKPFVHFDPRPNEASAAAAAASANAAGSAQPDNASTPPPDTLSTISRGVAAPPPNGNSNGNGTAGPPVIMSPVITLCGSTSGAGEPAGRIARVAPLYSFEHSSLDDQLPRCLQVLLEIHAQYYSNQQGQQQGQQGASPRPQDKDQQVARAGKTESSDETKSNSAAPSKAQALTLVKAPAQQSVGVILQDIKKKVLAGCTLTFSGLIPTNEDNPRNHTLWKLAEALGAQVSTELLPRTTHLISIHTQTAKVTAVLQKRASEVWVLHPDWLIYCRWSLSRCSEATFMLNQLAPGQALPNPPMDYTALPAPAVPAQPNSVVPTLVAPVAAAAVIATNNTNASNGSAGNSMLSQNGSAANGTLSVPAGGVTVPVTTAVTASANSAISVNNKKRSRPDEGPQPSRAHGTTNTNTNSTSTSSANTSDTNDNDMLSALKRLKAVGPIGTAEKDVYSFNRKYNDFNALASKLAGSGSGASGATSGAPTAATSSAVSSRNALFAHSSSSTTAGAGASGAPKPFKIGNTSSTSAGAAPIKKKATILLDPVTPTSPIESSTNSAATKSGAYSVISSAVITDVRRKVPGKHSPVKERPAPAATTSTDTGTADGTSAMNTTTTAVPTTVVVPAGEVDKRYYIEYDYENSEDRYFSLGEGGDSSGACDSVVQGEGSGGVEGSDADMYIAGMHNDNEPVTDLTGYSSDRSSRDSTGSSGSRDSSGDIKGSSDANNDNGNQGRKSGRNGRTNRVSRASNASENANTSDNSNAEDKDSAEDNDSDSSSEDHSLMGYNDEPAEPDDDEGEGYFLSSGDRNDNGDDGNSDDDDDTMDVGDEGQCCDDDNGSTCSATAELYSDSERALYPCSNRRRRAPPFPQYTHLHSEQLELEEGEVVDDTGIVPSSSSHGSNSRHRIHRISSTSSASNSISNTSNASSHSTNNNSSAEEDDCSDFEVMINRRRHSASNTETADDSAVVAGTGAEDAEDAEAEELGDTGDEDGGMGQQVLIDGAPSSSNYGYSDLDEELDE